MAGYWVRHRLPISAAVTVVAAVLIVLLFVFPCVTGQADDYNSQSIYANTDIDFIAPEPSYEQIDKLVGTNGIDTVFPYYLTKTSVTVNGVSRTTTVLLSDQFQNVDITMYNDSRLIEKSKEKFDNPILVDWQFCHDTSAKIGDTVSFTLGGNTVEYRIYAIYETNSIYDGGAILVQISDAQKEAIAENSGNNGYSGMYVSASDYSTCQSYMNTDYRPLGRLRDADQFENEEQYQIHYNAIMDSGYANEITDFRVREDGLTKENSTASIWLGAVLAAVIMIVFNFMMSVRGCEKVYFTKRCIPNGINVRPYYACSFIFETVAFVAIYAVAFIVSVRLANEYIPGEVINAVDIVAIPAAIIIAEIIAFVINNTGIKPILQAEERTKDREEKEIGEGDGEKPEECDGEESKGKEQDVTSSQQK